MSEKTRKPHKPKTIKMPRRTPSIVVQAPNPVYITPDKTTCVECGCFPKQETYVKFKKLLPCLKSPASLYELSAGVVDRLPFPEAFGWSKEDVAEWIGQIGLPEYKYCFLDNEVNGMRLLMMEDPSKLPEINVKQFEHIKIITSSVRRLYGTGFIRFARSISLPPRIPLTHCTWFKSRTGPSWGVRMNWTRCDILRWMKIIMPETGYLDHWDLVWYQKPDFPKVLIARIEFHHPTVIIPHYKPQVEHCREYLIPRKFRFDSGIPEDQQYIWMEERLVPKEKVKKKRKEKKKKKVTLPMETRLYPEKVSLIGKNGKDLLLARRKMAIPKFLV